MQLSRLVSVIGGEEHNMKDTDVLSLEFDSRRVTPGSLFIAVKGEKFDGHDFIEDAIKNGAVALITQRKLAVDIPQIVVKDSREAMAKLARRFYGGFEAVEKIGITGTNGKTTTAFLIYSIFEQAGKKPGLIGTVYYMNSRKRIKAERTTPESLDIFKLLSDFERDGAEAVVMEVSSHALSLKRMEEIDLDVAVFTNLSQDHLDFHRTIEEYRAAKMRIFSLLKENGYAVYNIDDPALREIEELPVFNKIGYGLQKEGDIRAVLTEESIDGLRMEIFYGDKKYPVASGLIGGFNAYNILAAFTVGCALKLDPEIIIRGIEELKDVKGRMERVVDNIFIDYAHTPSAVGNVLTALRKYCRGRLLIVFGCGGDRDRDKRPKMGAVASERADYVFVTSDNPRSEKPSDIIDDILKGIKKDNYKVIEDRKEAIRYALSIKKDDDVLLVAGKGHEDYQIIGEKKIVFDDAEVIRECLKNL